MDGDNLIRFEGVRKIGGAFVIKPCVFNDKGRCQLAPEYGIQSGPKKGRCKTGLLNPSCQVCPGYLPRG